MKGDVDARLRITVFYSVDADPSILSAPLKALRVTVAGYVRYLGAPTFVF